MTERHRHDDLDIHNPAFARDPYPTYNRMREDCPVSHSTHYGGFWLLTRYHDVKQAVMDWRTYTTHVPGVTAIPMITQRTEPQLPLELDPPQHSKYCALVNPVFAKARIDSLRPMVEAIAAELVAHLIAQDGGDLVAEDAVPLSVRTMAAFTGLPERDADLWVSWIQWMLNVADAADAALASHEFGIYIDNLIKDHHRTPRKDFIGLLIDSEVDGERLTDVELHSFCTLLFGAGFETTADGISVMLHYVAEHLDAYQ